MHTTHVLYYLIRFATICLFCFEFRSSMRSLNRVFSIKSLFSSSVSSLAPLRYNSRIWWTIGPMMEADANTYSRNEPNKRSTPIFHFRTVFFTRSSNSSLHAQSLSWWKTIGEKWRMTSSRLEKALNDKLWIVAHLWWRVCRYVPTDRNRCWPHFVERAVDGGGHRKAGHLAWCEFYSMFRGF